MADNTENLGVVVGLIISSTPPTNTKLLWYDTSSGQNIHKSYSPDSGTWIPISDNGGGGVLTYLEKAVDQSEDSVHQGFNNLATFTVTSNQLVIVKYRGLGYIFTGGEGTWGTTGLTSSSSNFITSPKNYTIFRIDELPTVSDGDRSPRARLTVLQDDISGKPTSYLFMGESTDTWETKEDWVPDSLSLGGRKATAAPSVVEKEIGFVPMSYKNTNLGGNSVDIQDNTEESATIGTPGESCFTQGVENYNSGMYNFILGFENSTYGKYGMAIGRKNISSNSNSMFNYLLGRLNTDTSSSPDNSVFAAGLQNTVKDLGFALGVLLEALDGQVAVGIGGENNSSIAFRVGISSLGPSNVDGSKTLNPSTADDNGLVVYKDGTVRAPLAIPSDEKDLATVEFVEAAVGGGGVPPFTSTGGVITERKASGQTVVELNTPNEVYIMPQIADFENSSISFYIKNLSKGDVTIQTQNGETVEENTEFILSSYESYKLYIPSPTTFEIL